MVILLLLIITLLVILSLLLLLLLLLLKHLFRKGVVIFSLLVIGVHTHRLLIALKRLLELLLHKLAIAQIVIGLRPIAAIEQRVGRQLGQQPLSLLHPFTLRLLWLLTLYSLSPLSPLSPLLHLLSLRLELHDAPLEEGVT